MVKSDRFALDHVLSQMSKRDTAKQKGSPSIRWACEHFHHFVYNRKFTVKTDHKPLEKLLSSKSTPPPRIQRWLLYLQVYDYNIIYVRCDPIAADYLSRYHPFPESTSSTIDLAEHHINAIILDAIPMSITLPEIIKSVDQDVILQCQNQPLDKRQGNRSLL